VAYPYESEVAFPFILFLFFPNSVIIGIFPQAEIAFIPEARSFEPEVAYFEPEVAYFEPEVAYFEPKLAYLFENTPR